jgi:hypothetical protein
VQFIVVPRETELERLPLVPFDGQMFPERSSPLAHVPVSGFPEMIGLVEASDELHGLFPFHLHILYMHSVGSQVEFLRKFGKS